MVYSDSEMSLYNDWCAFKSDLCNIFRAIKNSLIIYTFNNQKAQTLPTGVNMKAISENQVKYKQIQINCCSNVCSTSFHSYEILFIQQRCIKYIKS